MPRPRPHKIIGGVEHKWCGKCSKHKLLELFCNKKGSWDGLQSSCRVCEKRYREKNKIRIRKRKAQQYVKEIHTKRKREYRKNNRSKDRKYSREYKRKLRKEDPVFALTEIARRRILNALENQGLRKNSLTKKLIGCSFSKLRHYLEKQFDDYMTWENRGKWHVDHRVPCKAFDLSNPLEQRVCFWYKNLQPMWAKDNLEKSDKYNEEDKQALIKEWIFFHI